MTIDLFMDTYVSLISPSNTPRSSSRIAIISE